MVKPYYQDDAVTIYHADCRLILPDLPKVDLVLTDPPYGAIGGSNFVEVNEYDLSWDFEPISDELLQLVLSKGTNQIIWGVNYFWHNFKPTNSLIVWDKKCQNGWQDTFSDGEIAWTSLGKKLIIYRQLWVGALRTGDCYKRQHPTQKPVELMRWCIEYAGDIQTIFDPFMGSGTTLRAAKDLGRKAIGIEIEEKYCEIAAKRMSQTVMPLEQESCPEPKINFVKLWE